MALIREEEVNEIRQQADIVDIISDYLSLTAKGKNYVAICPFHDDHSPSMVVSRERQMFNCFTCRTGGNVFSFLMKYENLNFVEAVQTVAKKIGYDLKVSNITSEFETKNQKEFAMMDFAKKFYINNLNTDLGITAKKYLFDRGIDDQIIKEFNIGLAINEKDTLYKLLLNKKYSLDEIDSVGLVNKVNANVYDTFSSRIMIPIENLNGQVVGFTGRIFQGEDAAKYINSRETKIFKKSNVLFNYHNARNEIRNAGQVIVVEGNMDAIKVSASGIKNVVALMGVALSKEQIDVLKKLRVPIILMLDNDNAGLDATLKLGELLINNNIDTLIVRLSDAKDPDEYIRKFGVDALKDNIKYAKKYINFKIDYLKENKDLNNIEDLVAYVKEVIKSISNTDSLSKEIILSKLCKEHNLDIEVLKKELAISERSVKKEKKESVNNRKSKYECAVYKILYGMMNNSRYITIYKNKLGFFKTKEERIIASEIVYYNNENNGINIADFTTFIMNNLQIYDKVMEIINFNTNLDISEEEFNSCINTILEELKKDEIRELKIQLKKEMDVNKKVEILKKLTEMKKGSVDNDRN